MKKVLLIIVALMTIMFFFQKGKSNSLSPEFLSPPIDSGFHCNELLWKHIYKPERFRQIQECVSVSGIITKIRSEKDGDLHLLLDVDPPFKKYLNAINKKNQNNQLVIEVVCVTKVRQKNAIVPCNGYSNKVFIPVRGSHVWVTGTFVIDLHHGWNEIHPVSEIKTF